MVDGFVDFMLSVPNMELFMVVLMLVSFAAITVKRRLRKLELQLEDESEVLFAGYFSFSTVCKLFAGTVMGGWFLLLSVFGFRNGVHGILHLVYCTLFLLSGLMLLYICNIITMNFLVITEKYCFKYKYMGLAPGKKYALEEMQWRLVCRKKRMLPVKGEKGRADYLYLYHSGRCVAPIKIVDYAYSPFFVDCIKENIRPV